MKKGIDRCVYCGCSEPLYLTVDHKIPKALGGKNTPDNLQTCCIVCNQIKANRTEEEFKAVMKHLRGLNKHKLVVIYCPVTFGMHNNSFIKPKGE